MRQVNSAVVYVYFICEIIYHIQYVNHCIRIQISTAMASTEPTRREPYFDNLRLFLIFLVVLGHFCETAQSSAAAPGIRYLIYTFHMPLFIFLTGLFFKQEDIQKNTQKGIRFLILFLIMKMVNWFTYFVLHQQVRGFDLINETGLPWFMFAMGVWFILTPRILNSLGIKAVLPFAVLFALIAGYDPAINSVFMLSRVIVFWPFFLLGIALPRRKVQAIVTKKGMFILGIAIFACAAYIYIYHYEYARFLNSMLSAQHPYADIGEYANYGFIIRSCMYMVSVIMGFAAMTLIPNLKLPCTPLGERTLSVYFYDMIVYDITTFALTGLHLWGL